MSLPHSRVVSPSFAEGYGGQAVEDLDPLPRNALDCESLTSTVFGNHFWQTVYNFAFGVIAVDAAPRNCYINEGGLQPFDVILCEPDEALSRHLGIG